MSGARKESEQPLTLATLPVPASDEVIIAVGCNKKIIIVTGVHTYGSAAEALRMMALALDEADEHDEVFPDVVGHDEDGHLEAEYEDRNGVPDE